MAPLTAAQKAAKAKAAKEAEDRAAVQAADEKAAADLKAQAAHAAKASDDHEAVEKAEAERKAGEEQAQREAAEQAAAVQSANDVAAAEIETVTTPVTDDERVREAQASVAADVMVEDAAAGRSELGENAPEIATTDSARRVAAQQIAALAEATATTPPAEESVEVVMLIEISGTRDGVPWPKIGERITLPYSEAANYFAQKYVALPE